MAKIAVCGIGNRLRGDDAAGPLVIDMLAQSFPAENVLLLDCGTVPERFTSKIVSFSPDMLIIVDAVDMAGPPAPWSKYPYPASSGTSPQRTRCP